MTTEIAKLSAIGTRDTLQPRATMNFIIVEDYAQSMKEGQPFPPLDVVKDGDVYWLWDGYHRKKAAEQIGLKEINVKVTEGTLQDAEWLALSANTMHGFRRSNEDKRRAVELALGHPGGAGLSSQGLATHCGVSDRFVEKIRITINPVNPNRSGSQENGYTRKTTNDQTRIYKRKTTKPPLAANIPPEVKAQLPLTDIADNPAELAKLDMLPEETQAEVVEIIVKGDAKSVDKAKQKIARDNKPEHTETPPLPKDKYRCIVIDPPWPMKKIEREERPNQGIELDYPVMTLDDIMALPVNDLAHTDGCHLYLWVTQKYLPFGLELVKEWGFNYQCLMTWRKNVGITPYSWMYDTEHVIFAKMGSLPLGRLGLRLSFDAKVNGHSVKPETFFNDRVILASPEPRLEMFARKDREGFEVWGNEVNG